MCNAYNYYHLHLHGRPSPIKNDSTHLQVWSITEKCIDYIIQGKYGECIDIMEEIVSIKKSVYGVEHS